MQSNNILFQKKPGLIEKFIACKYYKLLLYIVFSCNQAFYNIPSMFSNRCTEFGRGNKASIMRYKNLNPGPGTYTRPTIFEVN